MKGKVVSSLKSEVENGKTEGLAESHWRRPPHRKMMMPRRPEGRREDEERCQSEPLGLKMSSRLNLALQREPQRPTISLSLA